MPRVMEQFALPAAVTGQVGFGPDPTGAQGYSAHLAGHASVPSEEVAGWVERLVIGGDFGANGYTTIDQADELTRRVGLRPGLRLLEVGTGHGWPGVYLAKTSGCQAALTDLPGQGLPVAAARATREGTADRCTVVASDGRRLPFAAETFDAVVHTDVLCCLRAKLSVLRKCRRVLRPRGGMAFYTIFVAPGLTDTDRHRALRCGPPEVATRSDYHRLLRAAGFVDLDEVDLTTAYLSTARQWLRRQHQFAAELAALEPPGALDERLARRQAAVAAIEAGLLRRSLFVATPPEHRHDGRAAHQTLRQPPWIPALEPVPRHGMQPVQVDTEGEEPSR